MRRMRLRALASLVWRSALQWSEDRCDRMSASLSYYALFSFLPLALLSVALLAVVLGREPDARERIAGSLDFTGSLALRGLLDDTLRAMQERQSVRGVGAVVGGVTLLFGASGVFSELKSALDVIWRVTPTRSTTWIAVANSLRGTAVAVLFVILACVALLASLAAQTTLTAIGENLVPNAAVWQVGETVGTAASLTILLAIVFRVVPAAHVLWRDAIAGAFVSASLYSLLKKLLAYYFAHVAKYTAFGVLGAVLGLLLWLYVTGMLVFYGAQFARACSEARLRARAVTTKPA